MRQRLALIAVEKNNVARFGLLFAQLQAQAHPFHLAFRLTSLQRVPGPPPAELFFRKALDSCERLMRTPSRASISARRRGIVQLRRSATGSSSKGVTTRKAASLFTGGGPGAMLVFSAATPPAVKSLRQAGEPYLRARQTPPRSWSWSNQPASKARRAPGPPRRDHVNRQEPRGRRALLIARRNRRLSRHAIHLANRRRQRIAKTDPVG